jgi:hypothetical protein
VSAKECQNFSKRPIATSRDARLDSLFKVMSLARQHVDVGQVLRFAGLVTRQVAGIEQFYVHGVAHLGDSFALADFKRPQPQLVMPARQYRIEGGPFWQIAQLQKI